jgi:hypothetical protein
MSANAMTAEYPVYLKVTGGLLQGYRGQYKDKIR